MILTYSLIESLIGIVMDAYDTCTGIDWDVIDDISDLSSAGSIHEVDFGSYYELLQNAYNLGDELWECMEGVWMAVMGEWSIADQVASTVEEQFYWVDEMSGPLTGTQYGHMTEPFPDLNDGFVPQPVVLIPFNTETFGRGEAYTLSLSAF